MDKKSEECYEKVLNYIENNFFKLKPASFMSDYELAMRNAIKKIYPETEMYACWFHFCQALRRKCSKIPNFLPTVQKSPNALKILKKYFSLPLLPDTQILDAFDLPGNEVESLNSNERQVFKIFLKYFKKKWLIRVSLNT